MFDSQTIPPTTATPTPTSTSLQACAEVRHTTAAVQQLRLSVQRLCAPGHRFAILWVPGHSGIPGNEKNSPPHPRALTICADQSKIRRHSLPSSRRSKVPRATTRASERHIQGTALPQSPCTSWLPPIPSFHSSLLFNSPLAGTLSRSAKFRLGPSSPLTCYSGPVSPPAAATESAVVLQPPPFLVHANCAIKTLIWSTCSGTARYTQSPRPAPWLPSSRVSDLPRCMPRPACTPSPPK